MSYDDFAVKMELDTAGDGTWSQDETARLLSFTISRGRKDALGRMSPGRLVAVVNNRDGRWSEEQTVVTGLGDYVPVRLYVTWTEPATVNIDDTPACSVQAAFTGVLGSTGLDFATDFWTGVQCVRVTVINAASGIIKKNFDSSARLAAAASTAYTFKARIKLEGNDARALRMSIVWYTSGDVFISRETKVVTLLNDNDWHGVFVTGTSPGTAAKYEIELLGDVAGIFAFRLDAMMFYAGSDLRPYLDGRQPGGVWDGTADQSSSTRAANPDFLLFEGFLLDVSGQDDQKNQRATITCGDFLEILKDRELNMGGFGFKTADVYLDRILDRLEGEVISNYGNEDATILSTNNYRNWTFAGGGSTEVGVWAHTDVMKDDFEETFEGDWWAGRTLAGVGVEGMKYNMTGDLTVAGKYRFSARVRLKPGDANTTIRIQVERDAVQQATTDLLLTQVWQKVEFINVDLTTLGTTRELTFLTLPGSPAAVTVRVDSLHAVLETAVIPRDLRTGQATELQPIAAYNEPAGPFFDDVVDSEPGQLFVKAKLLAAGGEVTFHDDNWRQSVEAIPRMVFADGDGLANFAPGLQWRHDARDRVNRVIVTSRGSYTEGGEVSSLWQLAPIRDIVSGEHFRAHYSQFAMAVVWLTKVGTYNKEMVNFGVGGDIEPTSTTSGAYLALRGTSIDPPSEASQVEDEDAALSFVRPLTVAMPLQGTNTAEMDTIAARLLAKYKVAVPRYVMPLNGQALDNGDDDLIYATQMALDLDELVEVRALFQVYSPKAGAVIGNDCFIEGIEHAWASKGLLATRLTLEAK